MVRVTRNLPQNYHEKGSLNITKNWIDQVVIMLFSITMLFIVGRLLLQFTSIYRPSAYEGLGFHDLYGKPGEYGGTFTSQFLMDIARALNYLLWGMLLGVLIGIGADNTLLKKET